MSTSERGAGSRQLNPASSSDRASCSASHDGFSDRGEGSSRSSSTLFMREANGGLVPGQQLRGGNTDLPDHNLSIPKRRHRPRTSGGFLLDLGVGNGQAPNGQDFGEQDGGHSLGKGKSRTYDPRVQPLGKQHHISGHRAKSSLGGSPLTRELKERDHEKNETSDAGPYNGQQRVNGMSRQLDGEVKPSNGVITNSIQSNHGLFDSDPSQIVNLALNLSESRRRQVSLGRVQPREPYAGRRLNSSTFVSPRVNSQSFAMDNNLKEHLRQARRISRKDSPRSSSFVQRPEGRPASQGSSQDLEASRFDSIHMSTSQDMNGSLQLSPSSATLLRVERAKLALELFYEYRRLLPNLPKLPRASTSRPGTSRTNSKKSCEVPEDAQREYNPLQYIRNRKLRIRERRPLDSETAGWKQLDRVRDWINAVANEPDDKPVSLEERYSLPQFEVLGEVTNDGAPTSPIASNPSNPHQHEPLKVARPPHDWLTTPWDLLADAYWTGQNDNWMHIEDRDGNKLFELPKSKKHSLPMTRPEMLKEANRSTSDARKSQSPRDASSPAGVADDEGSRGREKHRHQIRNSIASIPGYASSSDRKKGWHRKLIRSASSSSSGSSAPGSLPRRDNLHGRTNSRDAQGSAVLERQVMELLAKEAEGQGRIAPHRDVPKYTKTNVEASNDSIHMKGSSGFKNVFEGKDVVQSPKPLLTSMGLDTPTSYENDTTPLHNARHEYFDDLESTAPNSPTLDEVVPCISISLSPPESRRESQNPESSTLMMVETDSTDYASREASPEKVVETVLNKPIRSVNSEPVNSTSLLSPRTAEGFGRALRHRRSGSKPHAEGNDHREPESRIRGLLKGGRLAEIVGNEVSKVGDRIRRKEVPEMQNGSVFVTPATSNQASDASDSDEPMLSPDSRRKFRDRLSLYKPDGETLSRSTTNTEQPRFYLNNLPSFRSPLRKGEVRSPTTPGHDHISRQQEVVRERGRSKAFNRLAPVKLDLRGLSASPSPPPLTRTATKETTDSPGPSYGTSLKPSENDSGREESVYRSSSRLSVRSRPRTLPMTGLANLDIRRKSIERPKLDGKRQWSISDRGVSEVRGAVTKGDLVRARALLLSSGVKAIEITRTAMTPRDPPNQILQDLQKLSKTPLPRVARAEEHVLAARIYIKNITALFDQIRDLAEHFSNVTVYDIRQETKIISEHIMGDLTSVVRDNTDAADALSVELATSHRLEIKRTNDAIDSILRKRKRRFRWIRRGGYLLLEWVLLGAMWWVWLIVVVVRLTRATVRGVYTGLRWLLWI
ncbi:hypothetical protein MMC25_006431 [Agyrium rufum]|nr:hypothetical protein [Agyrium rufum]